MASKVVEEQENPVDPLKVRCYLGVLACWSTRSLEQGFQPQEQRGHCNWTEDAFPRQQSIPREQSSLGSSERCPAEGTGCGTAQDSAERSL